MVAILLVLALVLGIAFFQVVQGLFSALIMTILSVICAIAALNFYEPLAEALLYNRQPAYAEAISLVALFVIPLLALRVLFDKFISGNVVMGMWADRIGGGILGLISGMVIVGILTIAAQMLPFKPAILYYTPFDSSLQRISGLHFFYPDEFTVGMAKKFSTGSLKYSQKFATVHDDLLLETYCTRNRAGKLGRADSLPDSFSVKAAFEVSENLQKKAYWMRLLPLNPLLSENATDKVVILRVSVSEEARNEEDNWWRLPATHFRLVTKTGQSHYPVAYLYDGPNWKADFAPIEDERTQVAQLIVEREHAKGQVSLMIDWVYRIPLEEEASYAVFRRISRSEIPSTESRMPPAKTALKSNPKPKRR